MSYSLNLSRGMSTRQCFLLLLPGKGEEGYGLKLGSLFVVEPYRVVLKNTQGSPTSRRSYLKSLARPHFNFEYVGRGSYNCITLAFLDNTSSGTFVT